jgi:hypothetical protein
MDCATEELEFDSVWARDFSPLRNVETGFGAYPASYNGYWGALSLGVKRPGHEAYFYLT